MNQVGELPTAGDRAPFVKERDHYRFTTRKPTIKMPYLTAFNTSGIENTLFASKGLSKMKPGPVSSTPTVTVPQTHQIAYDGYLANIDAFLAATSLQTKVNVNAEYFPQVDLFSTEITFPLPIPRITVSFAKMPQASLQKIIDAVKTKSSMERMEGINRHPAAYIINNPTWAMIAKLAPYCQDNIPQINGAVQIHHAVQMKAAYAVIELYLRTNTYPAFRDGRTNRASVNAEVNSKKRNVVQELGGIAKKMRYANVTMTHKAEPQQGVKEDGFWVGTSSDANVEFESEDVAINEAVFVAKPSPVTSTEASFSTPVNTPNLAGLVFEYFDGMNMPDSSHIRSTMARFALRMLGKEAYLKFRDSVAGFASSKSGLEIAHIMKGMEISLEAQGQLHLLMDGPRYLGFVVMGARWQIMIGTTWYVPQKASELRSSLRSIKSHQSACDEIRIILKAKGFNTVPDDFDNAMQIAELLGQVVWSENADTRREEQKRLEEACMRLEFGTTPTNVGHVSVMRAIKQCVDDAEDITGNHVHFPLAKDYSAFRHRHGRVLAQFGFKAPSFVISNPLTSIVISEKYAGSSAEAKACRDAVKAIIIAMKPIAEAAADFAKWRLRLKVTTETKERAGGYRYVVFGKDYKEATLKYIADNRDLISPEVEQSDVVVDVDGMDTGEPVASSSAVDFNALDLDF
jgi:hypothetical protein